MDEVRSITVPDIPGNWGARKVGNVWERWVDTRRVRAWWRRYEGV